jgi:molybdopterin synthase sulfur carrier subunit
MTIEIKYFASLREEIGRASDSLEPLEPMSALEVWKQATGRNSFSNNVLIALNQEYTTEDTVVNDGDEVAFFPPVTGG